MSNFPIITLYKKLSPQQRDEGDGESYVRNLSRKAGKMSQGEMSEYPRHFQDADDAPPRKMSINELSEDEIVSAYNKLRMERPIEVGSGVKNEDLSDEVRQEFLKWMEMRRRDENVTARSEKSLKAEKVNIIDETENRSDVVDDTVVANDAAAAAAERALSFDEFKDTISETDDDEYLNVPLLITEDDVSDVKQVVATDTCQEGTDSCREGVQQAGNLIQTVDESAPSQNLAHADGESCGPEQQVTIDAKITLSNAPLEVKMNLSASNVSLASDKSGDDGKKRRANHSKGRAPPPPTINVMPGHFYDHVTKKLFKETEL